MSKANNKTKPTITNVSDFLKSITDKSQQADSIEIVKIIEKIIGEKPKMWSPTVVGFGSRKIKYASGREMDWMLVGFSPRKGKLTFYITDLKNIRKTLLSKLGKYKIDGGCLYIKNLSDINKDVLKDLIKDSVKNVKSKI